MKGNAFITFFALVAILVGCSGSDSAKVETTGSGDAKPANPQGTTGTAVTDAKDLKIETIAPGKGDGAEDGDMLTMLYRGTLTDGKVFDGNMDEKGEPVESKPPFAVILGVGQVIQGWDQGLKGVKVGETRKLTIPGHLAYGSQGQGEIPPNATLIFEVKCLDIIKKGEEMVIDTEDVKVGTGDPVKNGDAVEVHYVGKLLNGKQFDSSRDRKETFKFKVGAGEVVPGFDKGLLGMKKGGIRKLRIPPQAAYGAEASGALPGNSVLNFEIEVLKINGK